MFGFILEYNSSLRDFGPYWVIIIIGLFLKDDILACVENLRLVIIELII